MAVFIDKFNVGYQPCERKYPLRVINRPCASVFGICAGREFIVVADPTTMLWLVNKVCHYFLHQVLMMNTKGSTLTVVDTVEEERAWLWFAEFVVTVADIECEWDAPPFAVVNP
jgi:hypothetical protein